MRSPVSEMPTRGFFGRRVTFPRLRLELLESRCLPASLLFAPGPLPSAPVDPFALPFAQVGTSYGQAIQAYGPDANSQGPYTYTFSESKDGLAFLVSGNVVTLGGVPTDAGVFDFTVHAKDPNDVKGDITYRVNVGAPSVPGINLFLADRTQDLPAATAGSFYGLTLNAAGGNGEYTFTTPASVDGVTFFGSGPTLTFSGTPNQAGVFPFTVSTRDSAGNTGQQSFQLNVGLGLVPTANNLLAPGLVGRAYQQTLTVIGGAGTITFANPGMVDGLMLNSAGGVLTLSGQPRAAGSFPYTVTAIDGANHSVAQSYTLLVSSDPVRLRVDTPDKGPDYGTSLTPAQVGMPYQQDFVAEGGDGAFTFNFPAGTANGLSLAFKDNVLTLSGTPTAAGTFGYLLNVTDDSGLASSVQQYWLTVGSKPASASDLTLVPRGPINELTATQNVYFNQTFAAFGGDGTYVFSNDPATTLPPGLDFKAFDSHYVLSGVPVMSGVYSFGVTVESNGVKETQFYVLTIAAPGPLALTRQFLQPAIQNQSYSQYLVSDAGSAVGPSNVNQLLPFFLTAAGGSESGYVFTATGLPAGMTLDATGLLAGYPALAGNFSFTVTVTDSGGASVQQTYELPVTQSFPAADTPNIFPGAIYTPSQIRQAYGFNDIILSGGIIGTGQGQTIAVIENADQPTYVSSIPGLTLDRPDQSSYPDSDLAQFSRTFGLPQFASCTGGTDPVFVKLDATGGTQYPISPSEPNTEFALDIDTIHSLAPMANIVVFLAPLDATNDDLNKLYQLAMTFPDNNPDLPPATRALLKSLPPVSVVSSSVYFSFNESPDEVNQEHFYAPPLPQTQPATVVIAAGDTGYFVPALTGPEYPGNSANVVSAAMTQPTIDVAGNLIGELGVSDAGGGVSQYLPQPAYQNGVVSAFSSTMRVNADVGMIGSLNSGMPYLLGGQWNQANGSSNAAPAWSALMAIIDQGLDLIGAPPLNGPTQTLPQFYQLPASDFHKVSQLNDGTDVPGNYNIAAGLGTPVANSLVPGMVGGHDTIRGTVSDGTTGAGLAGVTVFLDANGDGIFEPGVEGSATTDANGNFQLLVAPGSGYLVRVVIPNGSDLTELGTNPAALQFAPGSDQTITGIDFVLAPTVPTLYVTGLYQSILERAPDPSASVWVAKLVAGASRLGVASAIWQSTEHRGLQVDAYYETYLNRAADPTGRAIWIDALLAGAGETNVQMGFLTSTEYLAAHATAALYVSGLYENVLGRAPDSSEQNEWENLLASGLISDGQAAAFFLTSLEKSGDIVTGDYIDFLDRTPDPAGYAFWLGQLESGITSQDLMAEAFLSSDEYFERVTDVG